MFLLQKRRVFHCKYTAGAVTDVLLVQIDLLGYFYTRAAHAYLQYSPKVNGKLTISYEKIYCSQHLYHFAVHTPLSLEQFCSVDEAREIVYYHD